MTNVSGFGLVVNIVATSTFPTGFNVTQFADDADPLDMASVKIGDTAMGLNGDLVSWSRAQTLPMVLSVIPGSDDDQNLAVLAEANRVGQGKLSVEDEIIATVIYPDGRKITMIQGKITDAPFGNSIASAGRKKSKAYGFSFQNKIGV